LRLRPVFIYRKTVYSCYHFHVELFQLEDQYPDQDQDPDQEKGPDQDQSQGPEQDQDQGQDQDL